MCLNSKINAQMELHGKLKIYYWTSVLWPSTTVVVIGEGKLIESRKNT